MTDQLRILIDRDYAAAKPVLLETFAAQDTVHELEAQAHDLRVCEGNQCVALDSCVPSGFFEYVAQEPEVLANLSRQLDTRIRAVAIDGSIDFASVLIADRGTVIRRYLATDDLIAIDEGHLPDWENHFQSLLYFDRSELLKLVDGRFSMPVAAIPLADFYGRRNSQWQTPAPARDELLVLGDFLEERGDPRAKIARRVWSPEPGKLVQGLVRLLVGLDRDEAAVVFAERGLMRERYCGRDPHGAAWMGVAAKRAWLERARSGLSEPALQVAPPPEFPSQSRTEVLEAATLAAQDAATPERVAEMAAYGGLEPGFELYQARIRWADIAPAGSHTEDRVNGLALRNALASEQRWQAQWIMARVWETERPGNFDHTRPTSAR